MSDFREERRLVTALFADVVGSTAIAERHDPEEARLIVGEAIARAIRLVEAYGGTVKDLAGDGMLALFGAPVAHEDDSERALRAGLDIVAAVGEYADDVRRGWGVEGFGIRVGVETGEVVVGEIGAGSRVEYGATGDAVNVAARLQALAAPGTVLAGEVTRRLTATRFEWGQEASLELKGRSEPVRAAVVRGVHEGAGESRELPPLVGRQTEVDAIERALTALESGRGGIVFVSGEPGIGKSRLTLEARKRAHARDLQWLEGRAVSYGADLAWWPLRDLLRGWIGVGTQEPELRVRLALRRRVEELAPDRVGELVPYLSAVLGMARDADASALLEQLSPEALHFQTYVVLGELITALANRRPLVVAVDDLHWADATTLGLFDSLLGLAESAPVLFFFNHRPETAHGSWALRERAAREFRHLVTVLDLGPLDETAEEALLASLSEGLMTPAWRQKLIGYAEGNPLYLEELARAIGDRAAGPAEDIVVPETLESVILARVDRLEPDWRDLLTAAAACGRTFSRGLLSAVAEMEEQRLQACLHNLLRLDLLQEERRWPDPSYRFKHALIQDTAYGTLVAARRRALHARAAGWLQERYRDSPERVEGLVAYHWLQAEKLDEAAKHLRLAGEQALEEWALDEAAGHFGNLVEVLRRTGRETEAAGPLYQLAFTLHLAMRFHEANLAWKEAAQLRPPSAAATEDGRAALVIGVTQLPWDVDVFPPSGTFATNMEVVRQLNDSLFQLRPGPCVEPSLAERLEVDDTGHRYLVHLRKGLTFNSGRALDAAAVVESFNIFIRRSGDARIMSPVDGYELATAGGDTPVAGVVAVDDHTVEIRLTHPVPQFPASLTSPAFGALPGEPNGPYRLVEMSADRVEIERDPTYTRSHRGNVDRARWVHVDAATVGAALLGGDVDVAYYVQNVPERIEGLTQLLGAPTLTIALTPTALRLPVDAALRRALALAVDRSRIEAVLETNELIAHGGLVPPALPGHTPNIAPAFDPGEARASLSRSSHRGPLRVAYFAPQPYRAVLTVIDCWREVLGLEVEAVPTLMRDLFEAARDMHVIQTNWIAHEPDPSYFLYELLHSKAGFGSGTSDPEFDELLDRAAAATNGAERMVLYHEADRLAVADHHLIIPLEYKRPLTIVQPWVESWWDWGNPNQHFDEVHVTSASPRLRGF